MTVRLTRRPGLPPPRSGAVRKRAERLLRLLNLEDRELSILLTGDEEMTELNSIWRGLKRTTDVLAFSQLEGEGGDTHRHLLGDVVICVPQALRGAKQEHSEPLAEITLLLVHGTLHLLGYEHVGAGRKAAAAMRKEQKRLLALLEGKMRNA
ncbi:MAG TPA: rRNA maturation RNase YbeY [Myxococcota bacterium]|nr:rRNA maturation RNase YbeY [Myxococcota bacterium]